jgi:hypothetical protein
MLHRRFNVYGLAPAFSGAKTVFRDGFIIAVHLWQSVRLVRWPTLACIQFTETLPNVAQPSRAFIVGYL